MGNETSRVFIWKVSFIADLEKNMVAQILSALMNLFGGDFGVAFQKVASSPAAPPAIEDKIEAAKGLMPRDDSIPGQNCPVPINLPCMWEKLIWESWGTSVPWDFGYRMRLYYSSHSGQTIVSVWSDYAGNYCIIFDTGRGKFSSPDWYGELGKIFPEYLK